MKKVKRLPVVILLFFSLMTLYIGYNFYDEMPVSSPPKIISIPNMNRIADYRRKFDTNRTFGYLWGIKDDPRSCMAKVSDKSDENRTQTKVTVKEHAICIKTDCYRIVGIYAKEDRHYVTLYNKKFTNGIRSYSEHEIIDRTIRIQRIDDNSVVFYDINSVQKWRFDFFDVNTSKYKPKDFNATQY